MLHCSCRLHNMDPDKHVLPLAPPAPPPSAWGGAAPLQPPPLAAGAGAATLPPGVLRVLPLRGSPPPVGYIYNATLMLMGVSWPRHWHFSPTMAIKSSTTPAQI